MTQKFKKNGQRFYYSQPKAKKGKSKEGEEQKPAATGNGDATNTAATAQSDASFAPTAKVWNAAAPDTTVSAEHHVDTAFNGGNNGDGYYYPAEGQGELHGYGPDDSGYGDGMAKIEPVSRFHPNEAMSRQVGPPAVKKVDGNAPIPFAELPVGTDLNRAPANYLLPDFRYGTHRHAQGFQRNPHVAMSSLMLTGARVDFDDDETPFGSGSEGTAGALPRVITNSDALKQMFNVSLDANNASPGSIGAESDLRLHVHRVGPSIVLQSQGDSGPRTAHEARDQALLSKALAASVGTLGAPGGTLKDGTSAAPGAPVADLGHLGLATSADQQSLQQGSPIDYPPSASLVPSAVNAMDVNTRLRPGRSAQNVSAGLHAYGSVLQWRIDDLNVLLGTDTPLMTDPRTGNEMTLRVHENRSGATSPDNGTDLSSREALDAWFDATLANVPQIAVLVHNRGQVQQYDLRSVKSVFESIDGRQAAAALAYASNALRWLVENCDRDGADYVVVRNSETGALELFDLTPDAPAVDAPVLQADPEDDEPRPSASPQQQSPPRSKPAGTNELQLSVATLCCRMGMHMYQELTGSQQPKNECLGPQCPYKGRKVMNEKMTKSKDALMLLRRSFLLFVKAFVQERARIAELAAAASELNEEAEAEISQATNAAARILEPMQLMIKAVPKLLSIHVWGRSFALWDEISNEEGEQPGACKMRCSLKEHDLDTHILMPALYGELLDCVLDFQSGIRAIAAPPLAAPKSPNPMVHELNVTAAKFSGVATETALLAITVVWSRAVDRHRKVHIDREVHRLIEGDKNRPSPGLKRPNKEAADKIQKDLMSALAEISVTAMRYFEQGVDLMQALFIGWRTPGSTSATAPSTPIAATPTGSSPTSSESGALLKSSETHLISRSTVTRAYAAMCEFCGDLHILAMMDVTHVTAKRIAEVATVAKSAPERAAPVEGIDTTVPIIRPPSQRTGFANAACMDALASVGIDPIRTSHEALRQLRLTKSDCRRLLQKNAEVWVKVGKCYSRTDRHTKAMESFRSARDIINTCQFAAEGENFYVFPQERVSGICSVALDIEMACTFVAKAASTQSGGILVKENAEKKKQNNASSCASAGACVMPLVEGTTPPTQLVELSHEEEANLRRAIDNYRDVVQMTTNAPKSDCEGKSDMNADLGRAFAGKFRVLLSMALLKLASRKVDTLACHVASAAERKAPYLVEPDTIRDIREFLADAYQLLPPCSKKSLRLAFEELRLFTVALNGAIPAINNGAMLTSTMRQRVSVWAKLAMRCNERINKLLLAKHMGMAANGGLNENGSCCSAEATQLTPHPGFLAQNDMRDDVMAGREAKFEDLPDIAPDRNGHIPAPQLENLTSFGGGTEPFLLPGVAVKVGTYFGERRLEAAFSFSLIVVHHQIALFWFALARFSAEERKHQKAGGTLINNAPLPAVTRAHVAKTVEHIIYAMKTILTLPSKECDNPAFHGVALEQLLRNALLLGLNDCPRGKPCPWATGLAQLLRSMADAPAFSAMRYAAVLDAATVASQQPASLDACMGAAEQELSTKGNEDID